MRRAVAFLGTSGLILGGYFAFSKSSWEVYDECVDVENWSGNHRVTSERYYTPKTDDEVLSIIKGHQRSKMPIRPTGTGLSPNGISFNTSAMINLREMDQIIDLDESTRQVRVQSGITVESLTNQLRKRGLTLQNFASIREQQLGGFVQVGAHGTGLTVPPVDEQVLGFTLISPFFGKVHITRENHPQWFSLMNVGLGSFGVFTDMTIQCVPDHLLKEETMVHTWKDVKKYHIETLTQYKHSRYLWIPNTKETVVIRSNPVIQSEKIPKRTLLVPNSMKQMLLAHDNILQKEDIDLLSLPQLRDSLLAINCSNPSWVSSINQSELASWKSDQHGTFKVDSSDQILGFDCGGQQLVFEVAFPIGDIHSKEYNQKDILFIQELMALIEKHEIPAPSPIEQRWTARSTSLMSPAYSDDPNCAFCWVGIIIYIPTEAQREEATKIFNEYRSLLMKELGEKYQLKIHWAKIEAPHSEEEMACTREYMKRFPAFDEFQRVLYDTDPYQLLLPDVFSCISRSSNK